MRGRLLTMTVLLALALAACGSDSQSTDKGHSVSLGNQAAATSALSSAGTKSSKSSSSSTAPVSKTPKAVVPPVKASYVAPTVALKMKALRGKAPAIVLLPDTGKGAAARAEASKLAALGIGS